MLIAATTSIHSGKAVQHFRKAHRLLGPQRGSEHHHLGKGTPRSSSPCLCCALHCRAFREGKIRSPGSSVWFPHCFLFKSPFSQSQAYFFPLLLTLWFFGPFLPLGKKKKKPEGGVGRIPSHNLVATHFFGAERAVTLHVFGKRQELSADFPSLGETPELVGFPRKDGSCHHREDASQRKRGWARSCWSPQVRGQPVLPPERCLGVLRYIPLRDGSGRHRNSSTAPGSSNAELDGPQWHLGIWTPTLCFRLLKPLACSGPYKTTQAPEF